MAAGERDMAGDFKFAEPPGQDGVFHKTRNILAQATGRHSFFVMLRSARLPKKSQRHWSKWVGTLVQQ